jgi:hypothetical protein
MAAEEEDVGCQLLHWTRKMCQIEEAQVQEVRGQEVRGQGAAVTPLF